MSDRELRPVGRFEWEQIIRRARFTGLIKGNAKGTRGGVSAAAFKAVALVWATHGNPDGTEVYPGDATLAVEAEVGLKVAKAIKAKLIELGLTERTKAGARGSRRPDEYRLTLPTDLLDVVEVLTPAALKLAAVAEYEKQRGKRGGSDGPLKGPIDPTDMQGPSDPQEDDEQGPMDPQQPEDADIRGGSDGPTETGCGGSDGTVVGGPMDRDTNPDRALSLPTPTHGDVRTDLTGPRATEPQEPDSDVVAATANPDWRTLPAYGQLDPSQAARNATRAAAARTALARPHDARPAPDRTAFERLLAAAEQAYPELPVEQPSLLAPLDNPQPEPAPVPAEPSPAAGPAPADRVWIATLRRGIQAHRLVDNDFTACRRSTRTGDILRASVLAAGNYDATWCKRCWPATALRSAS